MPLRIKKSKTFKGKFEVREKKKLLGTDLTKKEANFLKRVFKKGIRGKR